MAIRNNSSITALDLWGNQIGDAGAQALAGTIRDNSIIIKLNLGSNVIGNAGAQELAAAIEGNNSLTLLYLRGNNIGYSSAIPPLGRWWIKQIGDAGDQALDLIEEHLIRNINNKEAEANILYEQAIPYINPVCQASLDRSISLLDQAIKFAEQIKYGDYDQGQKLLKTYIFSKARAYNLLGQYDQALELLDKVLVIDNKYPAAIQYKQEVVENKANWLAESSIREEGKVEERQEQMEGINNLVAVDNSTIEEIITTTEILGTGAEYGEHP